ncbi:MAG TPA: serine/threonine-protein kinase, partial [Chitinophagaceae bacterium]|nr:serine/threonine-protein kinase [Chitinophagaceae bacterium]
MAKVFTIAEGLENMGALKTGGQGSVYKGRRIGEIITAVKILPTPIHSENPTDKNLIDFQNEVQKLKKVNEVPNPNVVKIFSSGFTESGSFPFIEMEFIEGPDLEELLKPPHDAVFTTKETINGAEQLSNALAHCHKVDVKHGDVKSNNVKLNIHTGNYVLLDFGLAVMSDEQRRTSLRHAGAIEFMAPEQNEGQMLFETDVYSFGIILYELLAGTVPFPLTDKGETARNLVRVAHIEKEVPDLLSFRKNAFPQGWSAEKREYEIQVPQWVLDMIYKCLEKNPAERFRNCIELHDYIILNSALTVKKKEDSVETTKLLQQENEKLLQEKEALQNLVIKYQNTVKEKEKQQAALQTIIAQKDNELTEVRQRATATMPARSVSTERGVSKASFFALLILTAGISAFAAYSLFFKKNRTSNQDYQSAPVKLPETTSAQNEQNNNAAINADTPKAIMPTPKRKVK